MNQNGNFGLRGLITFGAVVAICAAQATAFVLPRWGLGIGQQLVSKGKHVRIEE